MPPNSPESCSWPGHPRSWTGQGFCSPGFLEGQEGHERAQLFLEGPGGSLGLVLPRSVSASGQGRAGPQVGSDEGNSHRDAGGLRPLGRVMAHQVLHHRVFGHVLHQVGLLWAGVRFRTLKITTGRGGRRGCSSQSGHWMAPWQVGQLAVNSYSSWRADEHWHGFQGCSTTTRGRGWLSDQSPSPRHVG